MSGFEWIPAAVSATAATASTVLAARKEKSKEGPIIPKPDDKAAQEARRRSLIEQMGRSGRASTILTQGNDERLGP